MLNALITRWTRFRITALGGDADSSVHTEPMPRADDTFFQTLMRWIPGEPDPWRATAYRREVQRANMPAARAAFESCLKGLDDEATQNLRSHIGRARSMSDLWHLRAAIYTEVARCHSQAEAERRLALITPLFPERGGKHSARDTSKSDAIRRH